MGTMAKKTTNKRIAVLAACAAIVPGLTGCFSLERTRPPNGSVYYTGEMVHKPKNSMTPKGAMGGKEF
jgi:hypothetical protein